MGLMSDLFQRGYAFSGSTGQKNGANLEDLVTRATLASGSQLAHQSSIETFADATVLDDAGGSVNRLRIKAGGVTAAHLSAEARLAAGAEERLAAHGYMITSTVLTAGTTADLVLNLEGYDYGSCFDTATGKYAPTVKGIYLAIGNVWVSAIGAVVYPVIRKNGVQYVAGVTVAGTPSVANALVMMNGSTDYLQLAATNADGVSRTVGPCSASVTTAISLQVMLLAKTTV